MDSIEVSVEAVAAVYAAVEERLAVVRQRLQRPLSLAEKILLGHLDRPATEDLEPGVSYIALRPDRVAMQDATAQMALLQFVHTGRARVAVPTTVHCDHLIQARRGAIPDTADAVTANREVYDFLRSASRKYGIGFWEPGAGIIHQVVLENYAFPGGLLIGTDSHTPNAGGLGMLAVGVGGADAVDVMAAMPWEILYPRRVGVRLTGQASGWTAPKDVILAVLGRLSVKGGTNRIVEYFGPGARTISATGKATITNMGAELGATSSIFPYDAHMARYLRATERAAIADLADLHLNLLTADPEVEANPAAYFDEVVEIDLSELEPHVVGPHSPDRDRPVSRLAEEVVREGFPDRISAALLGSCTNSSYEDLSRAADVARQAAVHGVKAAVPFLVTPGSEDIRETAERDGLLAAFEEIGAVVLANACGPCIGQWRREEIVNADGGSEVVQGNPRVRNAIVTSFNRNFPRRNDGNPDTFAFITSPELTVAYALFGRIGANPLTDTLVGADGQPFQLRPPAPAPEVPENGFVRAHKGFVPPAVDGAEVTLAVRPDSERLQLLERFPAWNGRDLTGLVVLLKAVGKCTTDHISPAGPWLRFRGHLDRISDNMFLGAQNAFTKEPGTGVNVLTGEVQRLSDVARAYKAQGIAWVAVGDENYGEGSSREHAAMSPRYLGCAAVIARSFARIHQTNLKKQGVLPLTFRDPADYDRIRVDDRIDIVGLVGLSPEQPLVGRIHHADGSVEEITLDHTLSEEQIAWFRAGSALNLLAEQAQAS